MYERPEPIDHVVSDLNRVWMDTVRLQASRQLWNAIRTPLEDYSNAARMLFGWYRDSVLAGCRRVVDTNSSNAGLLSALKLLRRHAGKVREPWVVSHAVAHEEAWIARTSAWEARRHFEAVVSAGGSHYRGVLTKAAVDVDLERIEELGQHIRQLSHETVAHASKAPTPGLQVRESEIDDLLSTVVSTVRRWKLLLDAVDLDERVPRISGGNQLGTALRLFDAVEFHDALMHAEMRVGPSAPPHVYEQLRETARARYEFGDEDADQ